MSVLQFGFALMVPLAVILYAINFVRWLWRGNNRLAAVGGGVMTLLAGSGSLIYLIWKLLL